MNLSERDTQLTELMDDASCDPVLLRRTLHRFAVVNRVVSGWGRVYRSHLRSALARMDRPARILDIGCGAGDVLRRLLRLTHADGFAVDALGIDPDERALAVAARAEQPSSLRFRRADSSELVAEGARFDIVISNHLLHHLPTSGFGRFFADSNALSDGLCVHSDIARSHLAYAAYAIGITPLAPGSLLRTDGLRSIRRSYTRSELDAALPDGWRSEQAGVFRLLAVHAPGARSS